jgi:hypothetical protein
MTVPGGTLSPPGSVSGPWNQVSRGTTADITDTGRAVHGLSWQVGSQPSCRLQRLDHRVEPCHAHQSALLRCSWMVA